MKIILSSRKLFLLAFFIVSITNIIVLSGVALNRSTEPYTEITLTESELKLPYRIHKENSGLSLRLTWRVLHNNKYKGYSYYSRQPAWLNREKLEKLGFEIINDYLNPDAKTALHQKSVVKELFIVLENNGNAYKESLKRAQTHLDEEKALLNLNSNDKRLIINVKEAHKHLERESISESKLFAIDAGIDPELLRKKYRDQTRFIIAKGLINLKYESKKKKVTGYIRRLSVEKIHVALKYHHLFDTILPTNMSRQDVNIPPRYKVTLAYGSRYEPWIVAVEPIK